MVDTANRDSNCWAWHSGQVMVIWGECGARLMEKIAGKKGRASDHHQHATFRRGHSPENHFSGK
jgi:hypothetical protein